MSAKRDRDTEHQSPIPWLGIVGEVPPIDRPAKADESGERVVEKKVLHLRVVSDDSGQGIKGESRARQQADSEAVKATAANAPAGSAAEATRARQQADSEAVKATAANAPAGSAAEATRARQQADSEAVKATAASAPVGSAATDPTKAAAATTTASKVPARPSRISAIWGKLTKKKKRSGSGIEARTSIRVLKWVRRVSQFGFFFLFMYWLVNTAFRGSFTAASDTAIRMNQPVEGFLLADPFVALITFLSTHTLYRGLVWSLGLVALTLVFGRVFCGWICPFGTLHHFTAWLFPSRVGKGGNRVEANKTHRWQSLKYYLLYAFLAAASVGVVIGGVFDPICVMVRAVGLSVLPGLQWVSAHVLGAASDSNMRFLQLSADRTQDVLASTVFQTKQFYFHQAWFIGALFVAIVFMNRIIPRFWCRALCPLGALLGVMAKFSVVGMEKDHSKCTDCNLCLVHCQGADSPQGGVKHRQDECHMCLNCEEACPEDVIKFRFFPNKRSETTELVPERRTALAAVGAGAAFYVLHRQSDASAAEVNHASKVIRPPGSVEEHAFLEKCIRCAECMKVCPNNALHPAFMEAGVEGMWTPIFVMRIGYCEPSCVLCGDVCPTGAIQKINETQKMGKWQPGQEGKQWEVAPIKVGTAFYDKGRCLPWSMATPCIVCEEFCPTSPKSIYTLDDVVVNRKGESIKVQKPVVDPNLCVGCGACEKVCPVVDQPAVYVTSVGETRSKTNVILLENTSYNQKS